MNAVVEASGLRKAYRNKLALDDARFTIPARMLVDRAHRVNSSRSPSRNVKAGAGRFAIPHHLNEPTI